MLSPIPQRRITPDRAMDHPYFNGVDWASIKSKSHPGTFLLSSLFFIFNLAHSRYHISPTGPFDVHPLQYRPQTSISFRTFRAAERHKERDIACRSAWRVQREMDRKNPGAFMFMCPLEKVCEVMTEHTAEELKAKMPTPEKPVKGPTCETISGASPKPPNHPDECVLKERVVRLR